MKQKQLATAAKVSYEGLNRILNKHSPPNRTTKKALATALGTTVDELSGHSVGVASQPITGKDMIQAAVEEGIRRALPQAFEHPGEVETLRAKLADSEARVKEIEGRFAHVPASTIEALKNYRGPSHVWPGIEHLLQNKRAEAKKQSS